MVGATAHGFHRFARETGIMGEFFLENQYRNPEGNPVLWDRVVMDAVEAEPHIILHLNTDVARVDMTNVSSRDGRPAIASVTGRNMQTETTTTFQAPVFADCTGDGMIGALAGASFMQGREGRGEFGEEWAPEEPNREFLGSSLFFYSKDAGQRVRFVRPNNAIDITKTPIIRNRVISTGDNGSHYWWIEWGGGMDTVHDADQIRDELQGVVFGIWDYIKNSGEFNADNLTLEWIGSLAGRREYRRFYGDHVITQQDVTGQSEFDDAVAYGGWSIDLHPVEGMYSEEPGALQRHPNGPYQIPFRSLYSRDVSNLLFAGRDISATHIAAASTRVMATCAIEGQAIGTAATLMGKYGCDNREVAAHYRDVQQVLLREDASVLGVEREDPTDLLRSMRVSITASSTQQTLSSGKPVGSIDVATDFGMVLPLEGSSTAIVDFLADVSSATTVSVELWDTGNGQNYVPVSHLGSWDISIQRGTRQWFSVPIGESWPFDRSRTALVIIHANPHLSLYVTDLFPYGHMMLRKEKPDHPGELLTTWVAREDRGRVPVIRSSEVSTAFAPWRVIDPFQRPFAGPHLWMSHLCGDSDSEDLVAAVEHQDGSVARAVNEWLEIRFYEPAEVASVRLVLNDDVDADLVTLHHHRTPWLAPPPLLRDYRIEGHSAGGPDGSWTVLANIQGNRHRHAVHDFPETYCLDALRIVVTATNGAPYASIFSVSAFSTPSGRAPSPWR